MMNVLKRIWLVQCLVLSAWTWAAETVEPLSASAIVARAFEAAGGAVWAEPKTAYMSGYGLFWYGDAVEPVRHDSHRMWRVYPQQKTTVHQADGKVRIDSYRDGKVVFQLAFDGRNTYNQHGLVTDERADSKQWASNFGFGAIRHALDKGYQLKRLPDDAVDGHAVYGVQVTDPEGGQTLFGIDQVSFAIRKLAFATPRGWHERFYSDFFQPPGVSWVQPGRVRLFYNGIKANEIYWSEVVINQPIDDSVFVLGQPMP